MTDKLKPPSQKPTKPKPTPPKPSRGTPSNEPTRRSVGKPPRPPNQ